MIPNLDSQWLVALELAGTASSMCLESQNSMSEISFKKDATWVTQTDLKIEKKLREIIAKRFPEHHVLGEEYGGNLIHTDGSPFTWVLDPIDGTFSFVNNVPFYSSLIALLYRGTPVLGIASLPALGIQMSAVLGQGVQINGKPHGGNSTDVASQTSLSETNSSLHAHKNRSQIIATADVYRFHMSGNSSVVDKLYAPTSAYKARTYPDALGYYLLLTGAVNCFVDPKVEVWDVAPFHVILSEARLKIHHWDGMQGLRAGTSVAYNPQNLNESPELSGLVDFLSKCDQR